MCLCGISEEVENSVLSRPMGIAVAKMAIPEFFVSFHLPQTQGNLAETIFYETPFIKTEES